jgi:diaminopimelate epimerase
MGSASLSSPNFPGGPPDGRGTVNAGGREWSFRHVSIGNPQCAIHVDSLAELDALELGAIGPEIEGAAIFLNRTNVSWYAELDAPRSAPALEGPYQTRIRARIFERGVGETLSSGTGATGAAVAHVLEGGAFSADATAARLGAGALVTVALDGGELEVQVGEDLLVNLTGWATPVFEGRLSEEFEKELHETE